MLPFRIGGSAGLWMVEPEFGIIAATMARPTAGAGEWGDGGAGGLEAQREEVEGPPEEIGMECGGGSVEGGALERGGVEVDGKGGVGVVASLLPDGIDMFVVADVGLVDKS